MVTPELQRPAWAEAVNAQENAYELAVVVDKPETLASEAVALAFTRAFERLRAANPGKRFSAARFERMPWGLYAQVSAQDVPVVPLPMALMLTAATLAWFARRKQEVARNET